MIVEAFELYEMIVGLGIFAGTTFVLYSDRFLVVHRGFLQLIALGAGGSLLLQGAFLVYWPTGIQVAHLVFILSLVAGLYSLLATPRTSSAIGTRLTSRSPRE
jgi:hypothetical protein